MSWVASPNQMEGLRDLPAHERRRELRRVMKIVRRRSSYWFALLLFGGLIAVTQWVGLATGTANGLVGKFVWLAVGLGIGAPLSWSVVRAEIQRGLAEGGSVSDGAGRST